MDNCEYRSRIVCNTEGSLINERFPKSSALSKIGGFRKSGRFLSLAVLRAVRVVSMLRPLIIVSTKRYQHRFTSPRSRSKRRVTFSPLLATVLFVTVPLIHASPALLASFGFAGNQQRLKFQRLARFSYEIVAVRKKGGERTCQHQKHQTSCLSKKKEYESTSQRVSFSFF